MMVFLWPLEGARSPRDLSRSRRLPILGPECSKIESNHTEGKKKKKSSLTQIWEKFLENRVSTFWSDSLCSRRESLVCTKKTPILELEMNEKAAGREMDFGLAVKIFQGWKVTKVVHELPHGAPSPTGPTPLSPRSRQGARQAPLRVPRQTFGEGEVRAAAARTYHPRAWW